MPATTPTSLSPREVGGAGALGAAAPQPRVRAVLLLGTEPGTLLDNGRWTIDDARLRRGYRPSSIVHRPSSIVHRPSSNQSPSSRSAHYTGGEAICGFGSRGHVPGLEVFYHKGRGEGIARSGGVGYGFCGGGRDPEHLAFMRYQTALRPEG